MKRKYKGPTPDDFNAAVPIGTEVRYFKRIPADEDDIEKDVHAENSIGRYLLTRARESAVAALAEMASANVEDLAQMRSLQSQFNHYGDLRLWLADAIANGDDEKARIEGLMSTPEAREAIETAFGDPAEIATQFEDE